MSFDPKKAAVLIVDLQNDFLDPKGAYGRAGQTSPEIAALPSRVLPLLNTIRKAGGWVISTQFTLVPGKAGEPFISQHLKRLRPFLGKGSHQRLVLRAGRYARGSHVGIEHRLTRSSC